jgi:class 3 adenylate cyclase
MASAVEVSGWGRPGQRKGDQSKTVMVVGHECAGLERVERLLTSEHYRVVRATTGAQCLSLMKEECVDAFLIVWDLPDASAADLCGTLRETDGHKLAPILFFVPDPETCEQELLDVDADDIVTEPIHEVALKVRLRSHFKRTTSVAAMKRERRNLERYLSIRTQRIADTFSATGALPPPEDVEVCVMFTDVRDFTALSQELHPGTLFHTLSRHLGRQVDCVYKHGGYIDKFGGDGIMAVFDTSDGAVQACNCALEIMASSLCVADEQDSSRFRLGIGIHMGRALIGNIGSADHLDYSAIGETVNLAARLCGVAEPMSIVVSEAAAAKADGSDAFMFADWRKAKVRGIRAPVTVCRLLAAEPGAGSSRSVAASNG